MVPRVAGRSQTVARHRDYPGPGPHGGGNTLLPLDYIDDDDDYNVGFVETMRIDEAIHDVLRVSNLIDLMP